MCVVSCGQVGQQPAAGRNFPTQVPVPQGAATLVWTPVTQDTNGATLMNLGGYQIYYGGSASDLGSTIVVSDPSLTTYVVSNLPSGTWYFAVAAYTNDGTLGALSNIASKTIN